MRIARVLVLLGLAAASPLLAQENPAVVEARRLRDAGAFAEAAAALEAHVAAHPEDVSARRLLAETWWWADRPDRAEAAWAAALRDHPANAALRIDYARFLLETGRPRAALRVLEPVDPDDDAVAARDRAAAEALRGTEAWWAGDLTAAARRFDAALRLDPDHAEAARARTAIRRLAAPWLDARATVLDDDQPLTRAEARLEAGWFATPLVTLALRAVPRWLDADTLETRVIEAEVALRAAWPRARLEGELAVGAAGRDDPGGTDAIGRAAVGLRLPRDVVLRALGERWTYLWTVGSLDDPQIVESGELALDRAEAPGWAGQAGARVDRFPDGNAVTSGWAWLLAPLVVRDSGSIRVGYALQLQDSDTTTFTEAGVYDPYYTPEELRAHSAIAAARAALGPRVTLTADGAVAFAAEERAPDPVVPVGGPPVAGPPGGATVAFVDRDFSPWRARAALAIETSEGGTLRIEAQHERAAFFEITRASMAFVVRFLP